MHVNLASPPTRQGRVPGRRLLLYDAGGLSVALEVFLLLLSALTVPSTAVLFFNSAHRLHIGFS